MAMPSGQMVISDKMQFAGGVGSAGGEMTGTTVGWYPDERDEFISWLRGEFAAANAIIDSLCHHLKSVSEPGEYDAVIGSIQQRRCNWNPVLHMQQYFSVAEVIYALQQATWRRQQPQQQQSQPHRGGFYDPVKIGGPGKEYKRSNGAGFRQGQGPRIEIPVKEGHNSTVEFKSPRGNANGSGNVVADEKDVTLAKYNDGSSTKLDVDNNEKNLNLLTVLSSNSESEAKDKECSNAHMENESSSSQISHEKQSVSPIPKTFVGNETLDGKVVNVVDGMTMYEELFNETEIGNMIGLVNDLRSAGRQGHFQGQTYVVSKRPMKGHGREMIQLGLPIVDAPFSDDISKERRIEPIPNLFQDVIDRLMAMKILEVKPDSCIVDIYNEGDHSHPHIWPHWFGRPVCVLFLTECDMTFGRAIGADLPGDYRGSLKLSLSPGSMVVMEGRSADFAKHAIPSIRKQRVLVTLTKSIQKRMTHGDGQRLTLAPPPPTSQWVVPPGGRPKHYVPGPMTSVVSVPANGVQVQPIFVPAAMAFPAPPGSGGWTAAVAAPLRQHTPPGTGVFLPPGSGNSTDQQVSASLEEKENSAKKHEENGSCQQDCNGSSEGGGQKQNGDA